MKKLRIVFDLGGVLIDWDPRYLYRKLFHGDEKAMEKFFDEVDFFGWNWQQDAGRPFDVAVAEACRKHPQYCDLIRAYHDRYCESIRGQIDGSVEILYRLKQARYLLYCLSNWSLEKYSLARPNFTFFDCFDTIVISGDVRMAKPDRRIFDLLLERTSSKAEDCLLIDDSEMNIAAASEMGFHTIHYRSPGQLKDDLQAIGILE